MITLAEKNRTTARTRQDTRRIEGGASGGDWRARLLTDLCSGPEGTRLRRLVNERTARSNAGATNSAHRQTRTSPSSCARAIGALRRLRAIRTAAPAETARHELRIRFSLDRVDETLDPANGPLRVARIRTALEILDGHVTRAETFIASVWAGVDVTRVA